MFSLFRRREPKETRFVWSPAVDATNARIAATLIALRAY
jgi:hypothetical protein